VIPRIANDFVPKDEIYPALEDAERELAPEHSRLASTTTTSKRSFVVPDSDRKARSEEEMRDEAKRFTTLFDEENRVDF
jgi:hypothetical protein